MEIETLLIKVASGEISRDELRNSTDIEMVQKDPETGGGFVAIEGKIKRVSPEELEQIIEIRQLMRDDFLYVAEKAEEPAGVMKILAHIQQKNQEYLNKN